MRDRCIPENCSCIGFWYHRCSCSACLQSSWQDAPPFLYLPLICSTNDSNPLNGVQKQHLPITAPYPNLGFLLWLAAGELSVAFREKWPKSRGIKKKGQFFMQKKDEVWTNFENLNRPHTLWSSFCKSYALKGILTALHTYENTYIHTSLTANLSIIKAKGISSPYPIIPIGFSIKRYLTLLKQTNKRKNILSFCYQEQYVLL